MNFYITDTEFLIRKTGKEIIRDWIMFSLGTIAIYGILFLAYYIYHMPLKVEYLVLLFITCFGIMGLINKVFLRPCVIRITRADGSYYLSDKYSFDVHEEKKIRIYDRYGEIMVGVIGNMYLRIKSKEFVLSYGVTEKEMFKIKKKS